MSGSSSMARRAACLAVNTSVREGLAPRKAISRLQWEMPHQARASAEARPPRLLKFRQRSRQVRCPAFVQKRLRVQNQGIDGHGQRARRRLSPAHPRLLRTRPADEGTCDPLLNCARPSRSPRIKAMELSWKPSDPYPRSDAKRSNSSRTVPSITVLNPYFCDSEGISCGASTNCGAEGLAMSRIPSARDRV